MILLRTRLKGYSFGWNFLILFALAMGLSWGQAVIDESDVEQTLYVDVNHSSASDDNNGTSESNPLKSIQAAVDKARGTPTKIIIADGDYRDYVKIEKDLHLLIIEAKNTGKAVITGSDLVNDVRQVENSVYAFHWPYDWGMGETVFSGYKKEFWRGRRKEMVFVNGHRLTMRMIVENKSDEGSPVNIGDLGEGEFTLDESQDSIFFTLPSGAGMNEQTKVEVSVRGTGGNNCCGSSYVLMNVVDHPNLVLRGLVFQHSANHIKSDPALKIKSNSSGGNDNRHLAENILIENCRFINNKSSGFKMQNARKVTIRNSYFENNGIAGASTNSLEDVVYESCSFSYNNWAGEDWISGHHGFGLKMLSGQDKDGWFPGKTNGVTIKQCLFRGNHGPGFWQDYGGNNVTLEQCLIEENKIRGVDNEMTFGQFTLKNCVIRNNGVCNVQVYGASNMTIDGCVIYGATTGGNTDELQYAANFRIIADGRTNDGKHADIRNHTIINSVINASLPETNNFRIYQFGSDELENFGKLPYVNTLTSDFNRWYRRDQESFPWPAAFIGTNVPNQGWKEAWPDMTWDEYRALEPTSGNQLDANSQWVDVDLEKVADSVLNLAQIPSGFVSQHNLVAPGSPTQSLMFRNGKMMLRNQTTSERPVQWMDLFGRVIRAPE